MKPSYWIYCLLYFVTLICIEIFYLFNYLPDIVFEMQNKFGEFQNTILVNAVYKIIRAGISYNYSKTWLLLLLLATVIVLRLIFKKLFNEIFYAISEFNSEEHQWFSYLDLYSKIGQHIYLVYLNNAYGLIIILSLAITLATFGFFLLYISMAKIGYFLYLIFLPVTIILPLVFSAVITSKLTSAGIRSISVLLFPVFILLCSLFASTLASLTLFLILFFLITPNIILIITFFDGLLGFILTPWHRIRKLPQKQQWLCEHDHHRPVFKKLSPWLTRWTNRHILTEKSPCTVDFSDHWRCPVCDRTDWLSGIGSVVGVIGGSLGQPIQNGDVLSLPLIGADGRAVAADLDQIEVRSWPAGCHDVDVLNSVFIRLQYAVRKSLKDVPIHLAPGVVLSDAGRDLAARHFGSVVMA